MLFISDLGTMRAAGVLADVFTSRLSPEYACRLDVAKHQEVVPVMVTLLSEQDPPGVRTCCQRLNGYESIALSTDLPVDIVISINLMV